ncbi:MAG: hypothetical protein AAB229_09505 [Candidatus Hydrogenedentota bacterium]
MAKQDRRKVTSPEQDRACAFGIFRSIGLSEDEAFRKADEVYSAACSDNFERKRSGLIPHGRSHRIAFGKHRGRSLEEISRRDPTYMRWLAELPHRSTRFRNIVRDYFDRTASR